jgi:hypothetical protein
VDINLAWAIAAFFLGAILNHWNESRRHAAQVQAAREQAFEAMQRDTWVALQDALSDFWKASTELGPIALENRRAFDRWFAETQPDDDLMNDEALEFGDPMDEKPTPPLPQDAKFDAAASAYFLARQRATALCARVADDEVRLVVGGAIYNISDYQAHYGDRSKVWGIDRWTLANESNEEAIKALGALIRTPPALPAKEGRRSWRFWQRGGNDRALPAATDEAPQE